MGAKYSPEIIEFAKLLYVEKGRSFIQIAGSLSEKMDRNVPPVTIQSWCHKYNWDDERQVKAVAILEEGKGEVTLEQSLSERIDAQLKLYRDLQDRGNNALAGGEVTKASEAASLIDMGIKGERDVMAGLISTKFVNRVIQILREELDDETLSKVIVRLKALSK